MALSGQYSGPLGVPPPITARPDGLLSLLGLQTQGRFPQHLAYDWLLPSLDLTRWYLEAEQDFPTFTQNLGATAATFTQYFQVPQDECWVLLGGSLFASAVNTQPRSDVIVRGNSTAGAGSFIPLGEVFNSATNYCVAAQVNPANHGWLLRPLTTIGHWCCVSATTVSATMVLRVVRLQVS